MLRITRMHTMYIINGKTVSVVNEILLRTIRQQSLDLDVFFPLMTLWDCLKSRIGLRRRKLYIMTHHLAGSLFGYYKDNLSHIEIALDPIAWPPKVVPMGSQFVKVCN